MISVKLLVVQITELELEAKEARRLHPLKQHYTHL
jgi:hypothetical protein